MKAITILIFQLLFVHVALSQLTITEIDEDTAGDIIAGPGVEILVVSHYGGTNQLGSFSGGSSIIGIESGVVLTTGNVSLAGTGNGGHAEYMAANGSDFSSQLSAEYPGTTLHDVSALQFTFEATATVLQFDIVFASDEYLEYVGADYNDAIAVYIDGPGFSEEFAGFENVALVPGSGDLVNIDNVNTVTNAAWFVNNPPSDGPYSDVFTYDGFTKKMTIVLTGLSCGSNYTMQFAVADARDEYYDAALFIGANSIQSNFAVGEIEVVDDSPFCEGDEFTASITYNPAWNYTWSTGESGFGVNSIVRTAVFGTDEISVTVEDGDGCIAERIAEAIVHTSDNVAPWLTNFYYNYFVYPHETLCFGIYSADTPNERVTMTIIDRPPTADFDLEESVLQEYGTFCWTPTELDYGEHAFTIYVEDNNACSTLGQSFTFTVEVLCPICPICVYYENRTPDEFPLPEYTKAAKCIEAGFSEPVIVGDDPVEFKAGQYIELGEFFVDGPFYAEIIGISCAEDCAACCDDWTDFSYDEPVSNVFSPNGDGLNDYWFLNDEENSWCAFNAVGFEMWVVDRWGVTVYHTGFDPSYCCPFHAANDDTGLDYTAINWDGRNKHGTMLGEDYYWISVKLIGCTRDEFILASVYSASPSMAPISNEDYQYAADDIALGTDENRIKSEFLKVFPSPASDMITVVVSRNENPITIEIYDINAKLIMLKEVEDPINYFDVKALSAGIYTVILRNGDKIDYKNFIKQ